MHDYDRRNKRAWADPRIQINKSNAERFMTNAAKEAADISMELKTEFVGLNDIGMRLAKETDERLIAHWAQRITKGAQTILANSKKAHELWETLVKADVQLKDDIARRLP